MNKAKAIMYEAQSIALLTKTAFEHALDGLLTWNEWNIWSTKMQLLQWLNLHK